MPPRKKPTASSTPKTESNTFVDALKFCHLVLHDKGAPVETHVQLNNKTATAFNGVLAAGHVIVEDIYASPNSKLMIEAMSKCGEHISIVQLDNNRLSIKSDRFKAIVPCIEPNTIPTTAPDNPVAVVNDKLKDAIQSVGVLANEDAQTVVAASILIRSGSALATNGHIIFEYWHGIDLPTLALPKAFVQPLTKTTKKLSHFGFSPNSATFWFEDGSWIKSQLFRETWPEVDHLLNKPSNMFAVPVTFWDGLAAVLPFSPDSLVYFDNGIIRSHPSEAEGAAYEVPGLPKGPIFNGKNLSLIKPYAKMIDFVVPHGQGTTMLAFQGENIRGAMLGRI